MVQERAGRRYLKPFVLTGLFCCAAFLAGCDPEKSRVTEKIVLRPDNSGTITWEFWLEESNEELAKKFNLPVSEAYARAFFQKRGISDIRFKVQSQSKAAQKEGGHDEEGAGDEEGAEETKRGPVWKKYIITAEFKSAETENASVNRMEWRQVRGEDYVFSRSFYLGRELAGAINNAFTPGHPSAIDVALKEDAEDLLFICQVSLKGLILEEGLEPESAVVKQRTHSMVTWTFGLNDLRKKSDLAGKFKAKILTRAQLDSRLLVVLFLLCVVIIAYSLVQTIIRSRNAVPIAERRKRMREMQMGPDDGTQKKQEGN